MSEYRDFGSAAESSTALPRAGRNLVAVVGIDAYEHWGGLRNAVNDARGVQAAFEQLGFEAVGALFDGDATHNAIRRLLDTLEATVEPDDRLVVFFAGHGWSMPRFVGNVEHHTGYLIPVDGAESKIQPGTWIDAHEFLRRLSVLKALHVLAIIDACNAGRALSHLFESGRGYGALHEPFEKVHNKMSRMLITSALEDEVARDNGIEPNHSLFTTFLIEGLQGGEPAIELGGGRRIVHGSDLGSYIRKRVQLYDGDIGIRQNPNFGGFQWHKHGEMPIPLPSRIGDSTVTLTLPTYLLSGEPHSDESLPDLFPEGSGPASRARRPTDPPPIPVARAMPRAHTTSVGKIAAIAAGSVLLALGGVVMLAHRPSPDGITSTRSETIAKWLDAIEQHSPKIASSVKLPTPEPVPPVRVPSPPVIEKKPVVRDREPRPRPTPTTGKCFIKVGVFPNGAEVVRNGTVIARPYRKGTPVPLPCKVPVELTFRQEGWSTVTQTVVATEEGTPVGVGLKHPKKNQ